MYEAFLGSFSTYLYLTHLKEKVFRVILTNELKQKATSLPKAHRNVFQFSTVKTDLCEKTYKNDKVAVSSTSNISLLLGKEENTIITGCWLMHFLIHCCGVWKKIMKIMFPCLNTYDLTVLFI